MEKLLGVLFLLSLSLSSTAVSLVREPVEASTCPGDIVTFTCTVDTGFLRWQDGDGNTLGNNYLASTTPGSGSTQTVNGFTFTLISVNGNNLVSTATIRPVNSGMITLQCANGLGGTNRSTAVVNPFPPPPVFEPASTDSDNQVRLSWSEPDRTCCVNFLVMVSGRPNVTINQTEYRISNLPLNTELNATVRCLTENNFEGSPSQPQISLNSTFISSTDRISRCTDDMVLYRTTWSLSNQPTTGQVFTPQLSPDVRCFYGSGNKVLPMDRVDIRARETICNYTMEEAAEGNVMVTVNGVNSFGLPVESNHSSSDGNECQELHRLQASVATQQSTIENQEMIIAGVGGGGLGSALGVLLIAFIGLLVAFVVVTVMCWKFKKIAKQQLGTD